MVKTIRVNSTELDFQLLPKGTKVIVLVRDPRGVANSLAKGGWATWRNYANATLICAKANGVFDLVKQRKVFLLIYDDFMHNPLAEISRVANFFGFKEGGLAAEAMLETAKARMAMQMLSRRRRHVPFDQWRKPNVTGSGEAYYGTFRKSDHFNADSWKDELSDELIQEIQASPECQR